MREDPKTTPKTSMRILWMRIGVTTTMQHSVFSGGLHGLAIAIAESLKPLGEVHLISTTDQLWWDDCESVKDQWTVVPFSEAKGYDICIECGPPLTKYQRTVATKHIWVTNNFLIREIEHSIFPIRATKREFIGLKEIWTMDTETQALEIISGLPVRQIPFIWSPTFIEAYSAGRSEWTPGPWKVHCIETHTSNTSSCVLPLVILREAAERGSKIHSVRIHNADEISKTQFFKENTLKHCTDKGLNVDFVGRQRFADWLSEPGSCVVAHTRFRPIRPALLDLIWCGIPFIHNSPMLSSIGFTATYYHENKVGDAVAAFAKLGKPDRLADRKRLDCWAPRSATPVFTALIGIQRVETQEFLTQEASKPQFRVGFSDMWSKFNPAYNFFTLLLEHVAPHLTIVGGVAQGTEDIVIFGPFGAEWRKLPAGQPKIHFTGENTAPVKEAQLNLGFQQGYMIGEDYLRFPLWILEIDWFGADSRIQNPVPIPLSLCTKPPIGPRSKFCAFVVSNPSNPVRNAAFHSLNAYKPVDSAGAVFNTLGPDLFAGAGGGGGESKKVEFLKDYRFCIAYENSSSPGYCTEKLLHAKAAGCVPIYWGDPYVEREFNVDGFIDARSFRTPEELVAAVRRVEEDPVEWARKAAIPALDEHRVEWARKTMAELARRLLALGQAKRKAEAEAEAEAQEGPERLAPESSHFETYVINLDRRADRMKRLAVQAQRWPAVDGRVLQLTPGLRKLLASNDFFWKKAVAGCALSHMGLWSKLATSSSPGYLILEDDATFVPGWSDIMRNLQMPDDLDILYLGGVLPPNRDTFNRACEVVGPQLGRIRPNTTFGQPTPSRYFHFCAYAYYLTKRAARKLFECIKTRGIWTSVDHILCNPDILTAYVVTPLIAGCYQDSDPVYQSSKFNDFNRVDTFDSDLWNNNERFDLALVTAHALPKALPSPISDVPFACIEPLNLTDLYEYEWLCDLFGNPRALSVASLENAPENPIIIVQGPYAQKTRAALALRTAPFRILHLSDEACRDPVDFYDHPACKGVIRTYERPGLKTLTIPLGYHWTVQSDSVPKLPFRTKTWSFVGTDWGNRAALRSLPDSKSYLRLFPKWQDPENLSRTRYLALLLDSVFAPCPAGNNAETFRIYEALECGAIPLVVGPNSVKLPLLPLTSWVEAGECMIHLLANMEKLEAYRTTLLTAWAKQKAELRESIRTF